MIVISDCQNPLHSPNFPVSLLNPTNSLPVSPNKLILNTFLSSSDPARFNSLARSGGKI